MDNILDSQITIFRCDCYTEGFAVTRIDEDLNDCEGSPFVEIAFWRYGRDKKPDLRYKLRHIWRIIRKGDPYVDMVCMEKKNAEEFANHILKLCSSQEKTKVE